jgi:hypothetical protein
MMTSAVNIMLETTMPQTAPKTHRPAIHRIKKAKKLGPKELDQLWAEGLAVAKALAQQIAPMRIVTADDLKTRMR